MDNKTFKDILDTQIDVTTKMLASKNTEYAPGDVDVLHNFKQAAHVQENKPRQALAGMMVKHTISIYDMINGDTLFDDAKWDEKITDHINYLILLKAITSEENAEDLASRATLASEAVAQDDATYARGGFESPVPEEMVPNLLASRAFTNQEGITITKGLLRQLEQDDHVVIQLDGSILYDGELVHTIIRDIDLDKLKYLNKKAKDITIASNKAEPQ